MALSSASASRPTYSPSLSPAPDGDNPTDGRPARRRVVPPSRFRTSPSPPPSVGPTASSSSSSSSLPSSSSTIHPPPSRQPSNPQPIQPLPSRARSRLASNGGSLSSGGSTKMGPIEPDRAGRRGAAVLECAQTGWPPRHVKPKVVDDDLRDKVLMAVCAALASLDNKALSLHELANICVSKDWIRPAAGASPDILVSSAIRSHFRRSAASSRPALLSKHILLGSQSELALAPALHPDSAQTERRPRGTIWYLSAQSGYWNPFQRAGVLHLIPKEGEGIKLGGAVTKRKREEAAAAAAAAASSQGSSSATGPAAGSGIKIRLKMSNAPRDDEDDPLLLDSTMGSIGDELTEGTSSQHSRSLGSSSSGNDPRLGHGRRQRGPTDGFPHFARTDSDSDSDEHGEDATPASSLPNPRGSHFGRRPRMVPPKRLQARQSMPNPVSHSTGRHPHRLAPVRDDSDSSSSSEGEDFHEAMLRSDDFAFGMDEMDDEYSGDTPATTPRDGAADGLSDQQCETAKPFTTSASPPARRVPLPHVPTPAELLAGGPVPISADPNGSADMELTTDGSYSSTDLGNPHLLRHRMATAPHSPAQPFNSSSLHRHPGSAPPAGLLALPQMMQTESPSPSPARVSIGLPHLQGLPSFVPHSSPSRHTFYSHPHLTSGIGSTPNSPSTETKEQEEAFNLTLSLLPRDFKPISLRDRFTEGQTESTSTVDHFDEDDSICVIHAEDGSPRSDASGLFDDFGELGARETSLATSEEDHSHRKAERWALENSTLGERRNVKAEPSSPQMQLNGHLDSLTAEEQFSDRQSSEDLEDEKTTLAMLAPSSGAERTQDVFMSDEDEIDGTELFLGPESVPLDELERVWGARRGTERASPFSISGAGPDGASPAIKAEGTVEDEMTGTLNAVQREKENLAKALVEKVRAATAVKMCTQDQDASDDDASAGRTDEGYETLTRASSCATLRQQPSGSPVDATSALAPPKKKRRNSLLPKPLPAPVRQEHAHPRANTAAVTAMVGMLDLFTPESGLAGGESGSHEGENTLSSDVEPPVRQEDTDDVAQPPSPSASTSSAKSLQTGKPAGKPKTSPKKSNPSAKASSKPAKDRTPSSPEAPSTVPRSVGKASARVTPTTKPPAAKPSTVKKTPARQHAARPDTEESSSTASSPMTEVDDLDFEARPSKAIAIPSAAVGVARTTRRTSRVGGSK